MVGHADVGTVFQHHGRHTQFQVLRVKHLLLGIALSVSMVQRGTTPLLAVDVLGGDGQQLADGILDEADMPAGVNNLRLHVQVRCFHLVDGSTECLAVLPERLLNVKRLVPEAVGHGEYFQLSVEHL